MTSKNPFEIRLETLKMAKEMMDQSYHAQESMMYQAMEQWKESGKDTQRFLAEHMPEMYKPEQVVEKAKQFYSFITENK